ncbi:hypothetical protein JCM16106_00470 [Hydrogenophilus islandicus]
MTAALRLLATPAARRWLAERALPFVELPCATTHPRTPPPTHDGDGECQSPMPPEPSAILAVSAPLARTPTLDLELAAAGCDWAWWEEGLSLAAVRLFVTDMDSTLIAIECIDEIAAAVGKRNEVARITEAAMEGRLDFRAALLERVALLAGLPEAELAAIFHTTVRYNPGARALVAALKAQGTYCLLVSGGFTHFTAPIAAELGFDAHLANQLEVDRNGRLTGRLVGPIVDAEAKQAAIRAHRARLGCPAAAVLAAGDGANDRLMLREAGLRLGYRPKAVLLPELNLISMTAGLALPLWFYA